MCMQSHAPFVSLNHMPFVSLNRYCETNESYLLRDFVKIRYL